nr:uncharacterized protein LOC122270769 [Parasteatoda tepidariorum]
MGEVIRKRKQLTLSEKLTFLERIDTGKRLTAVAREFGISNSTASGIVKERSKIRMSHEHYKLNGNRKRLRLSLYTDIDEAVYMWFKQMRAKNTPVNGPLIQQKAREFGQLLGHKNFEGSSGWLSRFRDRHDMSVEAMRGPENSAYDMSHIGMTDEEIVSCIAHNKSSNCSKQESEYIVADVDLPQLKNEDIETPLYDQICGEGQSGESSNNNNNELVNCESASNGHEFMSYCDSTDEVSLSHKFCETSLSPIKLSEAVSLAQNLTCFFKQQTDIPKNIWDSLQNINKFIVGDLSERLKQRKITDFFNKLNES